MDYLQMRMSGKTAGWEDACKKCVLRWDLKVGTVSVDQSLLLSVHSLTSTMVCGTASRPDPNGHLGQ